MPERLPGQEKDSLTGIPSGYTLSADSIESEVDRVMIQEFMSVLAEVALSVASREGESYGRN
ncbi:MAG: hypothetical protein QQM50_08175 [Dehalococcoides mccartyi]|uniref:hypothetical protein n=1 Tax=Dehalococcoides TaxID=61434 RepID=UPI002737BB9F|nr:hypothetical protein [Dehalococcoides mccartyi]MDP4280503.1 hypothetical protein [Dehalococcoides mccartyi]